MENKNNNVEVNNKEMDTKASVSAACNLSIRQSYVKVRVYNATGGMVLLRYICTRNGVTQNKVIYSSKMSGSMNEISVNLNNYGLGNVQNGDKLYVLYNNNTIRTGTAPVTQF